MIEQQATVIAVAEGAALVEVTRQSGCAACHRGSSCETATLAKLFDNGSSTRLRVLDHLGLTPGEQIMIGVRNRTLVRASMAAYLLPLLTLIGSASAAEAASFGDLGSALVGAIGLSAGLLLTALITGGTGARARFRPVLLRRVSDHQPILIQPLHPSVGG